MKSKKIELLRGELIVSCQALEDEPLHSSFIMSKMALAAQEGGAKGIRANTIKDIKAIKDVVKLPVIGIIKREYSDSQVYITPTLKEVDELASVGVDIIAVDATQRVRPFGKKLSNFIEEIKNKYPDQLLMADCSTVEEALEAERLGFDFVATTLVGYTEESKELSISDHDFEIIKTILEKVKVPVIAEGNINTPEKAKRVLEIGCFSVVVGSAITRPQHITHRFVSAIQQ